MNQKPIDAPRARPGRVKNIKNPSGLAVLSPVAPPVWLDTKAGRDCFADLQRPLIDAGILQTLDIPNLALAAQFWSDYIEARELIRKASKTAAAYVKAEGRTELLAYMTDSLKQYQALLSKFAGSPIDRTKIVIRKDKPVSRLEAIVEDAQ